ncbi:DUF3267 domain-containing protein [Spirosoma sp. SC4-14]|uniref:DUF3267 domain-containing protein n=1 Tax=Spirosoma sp. SC4-14 TaxID=3128900 RepID=UPI0030D28ABA
MRPTVEELHQSEQYLLIESFAIDEMNQFVARELGMARQPPQSLNKRGWKNWLRLVVIMVFGASVGYLISTELIKLVSGEGMSPLLVQAGAGFLAFFLILPIHEFIHGLAFRYIGSPEVHYGWSLKSLMVYAYSQLFPTTMGEVAFVAAMPFVVLTVAGLGALAIWPAYTVFWVTLLLIHTVGCLGDFALIRYYLKNRQRIIYTYDDVEGERRSYFFEKLI